MLKIGCQALAFLAITLAFTALAACGSAHAQALSGEVRAAARALPAGRRHGLHRAPRHAEAHRDVGQPIVIENRPGASTTIASEIVAKAAPDGYTLIMASTNHTINPSSVPSIPYDTVKDFAPVTVWRDRRYVLVVHPSLPAKTRERADRARAARAKARSITHRAAAAGRSISPASSSS